MNSIVSEAKNCFGDSSKENGLTTGEVRSVSSALYRTLEDESLDNVLNICGQLLEERRWELGVIAYDWAYRVRGQYDEGTFCIFEYLAKNRDTMPRIAFRYALDKFDNEMKARLMKK